MSLSERNSKGMVPVTRELASAMSHHFKVRALSDLRFTFLTVDNAALDALENGALRGARSVITEQIRA